MEKGVRAMMLTWKDAVTTLFMGAIVAVYLAFLNGTNLWLISSARGTTAAVLALGVVGGCALGGVGETMSGTKSPGTRALLTLAFLLGLTALVAGVVGLITGGTTALAVLFAATVALWLTATVRHAFTHAGEPGGHGAGPVTRHGHPAAR
jgi:hypothetical protein